MNKILEDKLRILAEDELTLEAVNVVIDEAIEDNKPMNIDDNEILGQKYRAYLEAKELLCDVMQKIAQYKDEKINSNKIVNKGK